MAQTVIGIFENDLQATTAADRLMADGYSREAINISRQSAVGGRGDVTDEKATLDSPAGRYFQHILKNTSDALRYAAVAQQGAMVAVHTETYEDAFRAASVLDACGALNVDERAALLEDSMTREDRTGGYAPEGGPRVKTFSGVAENEKPGGMQTERTVVSSTRDNAAIIHSRIVERTTPGEGTVVEEHLWIDRTPKSDAEKGI